jgi:hypothetical protein
MSDLVDLTEGAFKVKTATDDLGVHIEVLLEAPKGVDKIRKFFNKTYPKKRIIIMNVPQGFLKEEVT